MQRTYTNMKYVMSEVSFSMIKWSQTYQKDVNIKFEGVCNTKNVFNIKLMPKDKTIKWELYLELM
jgi:predicted transglutaminase-like protease